MPLDTERGISRYSLQGFPPRRGNPTHIFSIVHLLINAHFSFAYFVRGKVACASCRRAFHFSLRSSQVNIFGKIFAAANRRHVNKSRQIGIRKKKIDCVASVILEMPFNSAQQFARTDFLGDPE
jgi:hypothetical protein